MSRKRGYLLTLCLAIPSLAHALGLGNIKTHSGLNQPLSAEIDVLTTPNELSPSDALISVASESEYEAAGIEKIPAHSKILFDMKRGPDGQMHIYLTTKESVSEAFLNFLVKVDWPNGHIMREYTILLDPPVFAPQGRAVTAIQQPRTTVRMRRPILPRAGLPSAGEGAPVTTRMVTVTQEGSRAYTVRTNDTLWDIAAKTRHNRTTTPQMMVAIYQSNPQAFTNKNANQLKQGSRLVIPTSAETQRISRREASQWMNTLRKASPKMTTELPVDIQAQTTAADKATTTKPASPAHVTPTPSQQDKLKLVVPKTTTSVTTTAPEAAVGDNTAASKSLDKEALDAANRTNQELSARLKQLEQQADSLNQLLKLKEAELQKLNAELKAKESVPPEPPKKSLAPEGAASTLPAPTPTKKPDARPISLAASEDLTPQDTQNILLRVLTDKITLLTGLAIVLVLISAWFVRRKMAKPETTYENDEETENWAEAALNETHIAPVEPQRAITSDFKPLPETEYIPMDAVAEAEVYISYGQYNEAKALLTGDLHIKPNDHRARIKLLEVYTLLQDKAAFDKELTQLPLDWQTSSNPLFVKAQTLLNETQWPHTTATKPAPVPTVRPELIPEPQSIALEQLVEPEVVLSKAPLVESSSTIDTENLHPHSVPEPEAINLSEEFSPPETIIPQLKAAEPTAVEALVKAPETIQPETVDTITMLPDEITAQPSKMPTPEIEEAVVTIPPLAEKPQSETLPPVIAWTPSQPVAPAAEIIPPALQMPETPVEEPLPPVLIEQNPAHIKLELARSYIELGDPQEARNMLQEVLTEGNEQQQQDARNILETLPA